MDNGAWFFAIFGLPVLLGVLAAAPFALLIVAVGLNLALTKLVAFTLDSLRARLRTRAGHRALRTAERDPRPSE